MKNTKQKIFFFLSICVVPKEEECRLMDIPKCRTGEAAKVHTGFDSCPYFKCGKFLPKSISL